MLAHIQPVFGTHIPAPGLTGAWYWQSGTMDAADSGLLSEDEQIRVASLIHDQKRQRLTAGLAGRKHLLARLLGCTAESLQIAHDDGGRPILPDYPGMEISFSDSEDWNALALSRSGPAGIDLERIHPVDWQPMLGMLAGPDEAQTIRQMMTDGAKPETFLRCWVAKEAVLKAAGTGLKGGARRINLPAAYIEGRLHQFDIEHDGHRYRVETTQTDEIVLGRALAI